ncbi:hypothetical protein PR202_gb24839 [Eleusine coracana subsp. coracana]|uniref:SIAH-type domain-containing protein n=1 Tax=Eleusine coracana subsp. coracana TaxID=191504 RepID=A0AAV5FP05_ELECO|nr:hypothetical protein PR202_gb24839 [Eleusine coracana subsp. coracana]
MEMADQGPSRQSARRLEVDDDTSSNTSRKRACRLIRPPPTLPQQQQRERDLLLITSEQQGSATCHPNVFIVGFVGQLRHQERDSGSENAAGVLDCRVCFQPRPTTRQGSPRPCVPCGCPDDEACGFVGSMAALLDHIAAAHDWPCIAETSPAGSFIFVDHRDGMKIVTQVRATAEHMLVLNVMRTPLGRAVYAFCVHPHPAATVDELFLQYSCVNFGSYHWYDQMSQAKTACTDLISNRAASADSSEYFQLLLPRTLPRNSTGVIGFMVQPSARSN